MAIVGKRESERAREREREAFVAESVALLFLGAGYSDFAEKPGSHGCSRCHVVHGVVVFPQFLVSRVQWLACCPFSPPRIAVPCSRSDEDPIED